MTAVKWGKRFPRVALKESEELVISHLTVVHGRKV